MFQEKIKYTCREKRVFGGLQRLLNFQSFNPGARRSLINLIFRAMALKVSFLDEFVRNCRTIGVLGFLLDLRISSSLFSTATESTVYGIILALYFDDRFVKEGPYIVE